MLKNIVVGFVSAMAAFLTYVWMQPAEFMVARSATIAAPPAAVFANVNDLKKFNAWSPWAKKDPAARVAYGGPQSGEGAEFAWSGNQDVGEGKMTIVESKPDRSIKIRLDFVKPFAGSNGATFVFEPVGEATKVTWTLAGENGFLARAFMIAIGVDMEKMIGDDYEAGLANLKALVEAAPKT